MTKKSIKFMDVMISSPSILVLVVVVSVLVVISIALGETDAGDEAGVRSDRNNDEWIGDVSTH